MTMTASTHQTSHPTPTSGYSSARTVRLPVHHDVDNLLMWRDPKKTGTVVALATIAFFLLRSSFSLAWGLSTLSLIIVVSSTAWAKAAAFFNRDGPPVPYVCREGISEEDVRKFATSVQKPLNNALAVTGQVLTGKDTRSSILVIGTLALASWVFRYVTFTTLMLTVVILAFSVPKLYELNKERLDRLGSQVQIKGKQLYTQFENQIRTHVPSQKKLS